MKTSVVTGWGGIGLTEAVNRLRRGSGARQVVESMTEYSDTRLGESGKKDPKSVVTALERKVESTRTAAASCRCTGTGIYHCWYGICANRFFSLLCLSALLLMSQMLLVSFGDPQVCHLYLCYIISSSTSSSSSCTPLPTSFNAS